MKKILLLIMLVIASAAKQSPSFAQAPSWLWAQSAGGTGQDNVQSISTDAGSNVYVLGYFNSPSITFGTTSLTNAGGGANDLFIVKYDNSGNVIWAKSAGGTGQEFAYGITTDDSDNVYVTGYFQSPSITFGTT